MTLEYSGRSSFLSFPPTGWKPQGACRGRDSIKTLTADEKLTPVNTGASSLKTAVSDSIAALVPIAGLRHAKDAQSIINDVDVKNNGHQKVVIMFTDGVSNHDYNFDDKVANDTIEASKSISAAGATVYTIGCFGTAPSDTSGTGKYMNYVSSNYPNATSMTSGGTEANPANYYKTVSSAADLNNIFTTSARPSAARLSRWARLKVSYDASLITQVAGGC